MKKDLQSYKKHDDEFNTDLNSYETTISVIEKYDSEKQFERHGFELAIKLTSKLPNTHIDIGSGNGWLLRKMSQHFEKVIGIEPSKTGAELSLKVNSNKKNISVLNMDMIDGIKDLNPQKPVFMTTSTVLNHIENYYVKEFLSNVNLLPIDSILFFDERYDKEADLKMWHVRNKDWWRKSLPNWQLIFLDISIDNYPSGIYGICLGKEKLQNKYNETKLQKVMWATKQFARKVKWSLKK